ELNRDFHFKVFEASGNGQLVENIRVFWSQLDTMLAATSFHLIPNRTEDDVAEHEELVKLLQARDPDPLEVELLARRHRLRTATYLRNKPWPWGSDGLCPSRRGALARGVRCARGVARHGQPSAASPSYLAVVWRPTATPRPRRPAGWPRRP